MNIETLAIHAGQAPDPVWGAVMTPIYQTSTYAQKEMGQHPLEYARTGNPTRTALQDCVAALEGGKHGLAFSSGMAAIDTVLRLLQPGDHVLASNDVYGGTYRIFKRVYATYGIQMSNVEMSDLDAVRGGIQPNTKMIWVETPTNPLLKVADIAAIASLLPSTPLQKEKGEGAGPRPLLIVDNTFASPYLQKPLALGADLVLHSATKYLGGHSDVVSGVLALNDTAIFKQLKFLQNAIGAVPGPQDCFLVLRGIKTLHVRMDRHCANALKIASWLELHPRVKRVLYPGLKSHPQHKIAKQQMTCGFGGMISFIVESAAAAKRIVESTQLFTLAESLGGVESLIEAPAAMTHLSVAGSPLEVSPALIRLSVGIENVEDLLADLDAALKQS
jgi:cystathionine beta-lyase/cystathionine gamma-synthase